MKADIGSCEPMSGLGRKNPCGRQAPPALSTCRNQERTMNMKTRITLQALMVEITKTRFSKLVRFLCVLCMPMWAVSPAASAQTPPALDIQLYAGLSIRGAVGAVYSIEYVTELAQTN